MNQRGGVWIGLFVILLGFGIAGGYIVFLEPFVLAIATALGIGSNAVQIISGISLLFILITIYYALTQNTTLPWWAQ